MPLEELELLEDELLDELELDDELDEAELLDELELLEDEELLDELELDDGVFAAPPQALSTSDIATGKQRINRAEVLITI